jgi:uncharacterized protein DUF5946
MVTICRECNAVHPDDLTCQDDFYQLLGWESEASSRSEVHHLAVLSYHLQHPSLYSPEGLAGARQLLLDFLERGKTPQNVRAQNRGRLNSANRQWTIKGTPELHAYYVHPVRWTMTVADVVAGGPDDYCEHVRTWAASILAALKTSQNL